MMKLIGAAMLGVGLALAGISFAQTKPATSTAPATSTKPATPACCGDECKKMGGACCKTDDAGKTTCSMGGSCCVKPK